MNPFTPSILKAIDWATDPNYPAGPDPWSGQPTKVAPVANKLTPNEHPAAEELNAIWSDRGLRLLEAFADLGQIHRRAQASGLRVVSNPTGDLLQSAAVTAKGRLFSLFYNAGAPNATFVRTLLGDGGVGSLGTAHAPFVALPTAGGNLTPTVASANGELVLIGDSPASYIYDADTGVFSAALAGQGPTDILLDAIPLAAGGWLSLWVNALAYALPVANTTGPRSWGAQPATAFQIRTISALGAVGPDTSIAGIAGCQGALGFALNELIRPYLIRCGDDSNIFFLATGGLGQKVYGAHSADGGATWNTRAMPVPFVVDTVWSLEWCSITGRLVLTATNVGQTNVYYSADYGVTWNQIGATINRAPGGSAAVCTFGPYDVRRMSSGILCALSLSYVDTALNARRPIHVSDDGGVNWHAVGYIGTQNGFPTWALEGRDSMATGGANNLSRWYCPQLSAQGL